MDPNQTAPHIVFCFDSSWIFATHVISRLYFHDQKYWQHEGYSYEKISAKHSITIWIKRILRAIRVRKIDVCWIRSLYEYYNVWLCSVCYKTDLSGWRNVEFSTVNNLYQASIGQGDLFKSSHNNQLYKLIEDLKLEHNETETDIFLPGIVCIT